MWAGVGAHVLWHEVFRQISVLHADGELAAARHRVACIGCQVQDHLLDLVAIDSDLVDLRREIRSQFDVLRNQSPHHALDARYDIAQVQHLRRQDLLATEREQSVRERCRMVRSLDDLCEVRSMFL